MMDIRTLWQNKLLQLLHDPPTKAVAMMNTSHTKEVRALFEALTGKTLKLSPWDKAPEGADVVWVPKRPDLLAAGADRPVLDRGRADRHTTAVRVNPGEPVTLTHPLTRAPLQLTPSETLTRLMTATQEDAPWASPRPLPEGERSPEEEDTPPPPLDWGDAAALREAVWWYWRAWRESIPIEGGGAELQLLPADTRAPDHALWDHTRMASALAFATRRDLGLRPWLLVANLGGVQRWIGHARSSRDLWLGSFLISELTLAAMEPFVDAYGPDCILTPDLRGSARFDAWMAKDHASALPEGARKAATFASLIPNRFVAALPRGGVGDLPTIEALGAAAKARVAARWRELVEPVHAWLKDGPMADPERISPEWEETWARHLSGAFELTWSAVPWDKPEAESLKEPPPTVPDAALDTGRESLTNQSPQGTRRLETAREARLTPFVDADTWAHYERARRTYLFVNKTYLHEGGFDFPLVHQALTVAHSLRKEARAFPQTAEEGEKCTLCGERQALGAVVTRQGLDRDRDQLKGAWAHKDLDPEQSGRDRLCGVCAARRYLVEGQALRARKRPEDVDLPQVWFGPNWRGEVDWDKDLRVPFPSTSTLSLQSTLAGLATSDDPGIQRSVSDFVAAFKALMEPLGLQRTTFPRSLPTLALAAKRALTAAQRELLKIDVQYLMEPAWERLRIRHEMAGAYTTEILRAEEAGQGVWAALKDLNDALKRNDPRRIPAPDERIAVIKLDGDGLGKLLVGAMHRDEKGIPRSVIQATWRDVLHPDVGEKIKEKGEDPDHWLTKAGWPGLLDAPRLIGPGVHALISRALAFFGHTVVPWVAEREFPGRLIYSGGDDLLILAPAGCALALAARLQQLYSAPWVVDTQHSEDPWAWRSRNWTPPKGIDTFEALASRARSRFVIPQLEDEATTPLPFQRAQTPIGGEGPSPVKEGWIVPMLGPHHTLSAGIAIARFNHPLGGLIRHASGHLLDDLAKGARGGAALAVSIFTRSGPKAEAAIPWGRDPSAPQAHALLERVTEAFRRGDLARGLPYKLRERADTAFMGLQAMGQPPRGQGAILWGDEHPPDWLNGLVRGAVGGELPPELESEVTRLWWSGLCEALSVAGSSDSDPSEPALSRALEHSVDALLLCRALSQVSVGDDQGDEG